VISSDLRDRLASTDGLHSDSTLEFRTVRAKLAHGWESQFQGRHPASGGNDGLSRKTSPAQPCRPSIGDVIARIIPVLGVSLIALPASYLVGFAGTPITVV
jgi:hypothetical protein